MKKLIVAMVIMLSIGCVKKPTMVMLDAGADKVKIYRKTDPPANCVEIRPFSVTSGNGCGTLGTPGSFEAAYNMFRNTVVQMGGNVGLIENEVPPKPVPGCWVNEYIINGVAYACPSVQ